MRLFRLEIPTQAVALDAVDTAPLEAEQSKTVTEIASDVAQQNNMACGVGKCNLHAVCTKLSAEQLSEVLFKPLDEVSEPGYEIEFMCSQRCKEPTRVKQAAEDLINLIDLAAPSE